MTCPVQNPCDDPLMCFTKVGEPQHFDSHVCFSKRVPSKLEPLEAAGVIAALEDGITKLQILYKTIPVEKYQEDEEPYRGLEKRFPKDEDGPGNYSEFGGVRPMDVRVMLKLQTDRTFAERVLRKTVEDLRCDNSFGSLHGCMALQNAKRVDENWVMETLRQSKEKEAMNKELLASEKELMLRQDLFWDQKEEELLAASHDTRLLSGLTLSFVRLWEETRREQLNLMKHRQDDNLQNEIDDILDNLQVQEERAHAEITHFLDGEHEHLKHDLDRWTDEYDEQMATRDAELTNLRQHKEANLDALAQGKREMELRKEVKEKALELREKFEKKKDGMIRVITIQAWWRGIYYRKNLAEKALQLLKKGKKGKDKKGKKK